MKHESNIKNNKQHEFINILNSESVDKLKSWFKKNKIEVSKSECENILLNKDSLMIKAFYISKIID